jgi:GT2 family glycosyltransferase
MRALNKQQTKVKSQPAEARHAHRPVRSKVSIVILNWNGKGLVRDCIHSIKKNTVYPNFEIIVVDNGSRDGSVEMLMEMKQKGVIQKLVLNKENTGFAAGNNQGFEIASGKYYFMLNNDTLVTKGWLEAAVNLLESSPKIAAVGLRMIDKENWEKKDFALGNDREKLTVCGGAMLLRKSVVKEIGLLDAKHFSPVYGEEQDWCYRARNAGYRMIETDKGIVIHLGSTDTKRQTGREWQFVTMNTHRLKAMLFNLSIPDFLRHAPGLGLIFLKSLREGTTLLLLRSYWNNLKGLGEVLEERKKRKARLF